MIFLSICINTGRDSFIMKVVQINNLHPVFVSAHNPQKRYFNFVLVNAVVGEETFNKQDFLRNFYRIYALLKSTDIVILLKSICLAFTSFKQYAVFLFTCCVCLHLMLHTFCLELSTLLLLFYKLQDNKEVRSH